MKKRVSLLLVLILMMSVITQGITFAVVVSTTPADVAESFSNIYDELTEIEKGYLSTAKENVMDYVNDSTDDVWLDIFESSSGPQMMNNYVENALGEDALDKLIGFIGNMTALYYSNSVGIESDVQAFIDENSNVYEDLFGTDPSTDGSLSELLNLLISTQGNLKDYVDYGDVTSLSNATDVVAQIETVIKDAVLQELELNYSYFEGVLGRAGWTVEDVLDAMNILADASDPDKNARLALANGAVRGETEIFSGDTSITEGHSTSFTISVMGSETNLVKFASESNIVSFSGAKMTGESSGTATVYVYRNAVDPVEESLNYIYAFDVTINAAPSPSPGPSPTPAPVPVAPDAPDVTNDDELNTVSGMVEGLEYKLDDESYVIYDESVFNALDFSGVHTLLVRAAAEGINPFGDVTTLTFTTNPEKPEPIVFDDVENHWAESDIYWAVDRGIIIGKAPGVFDPDALLTRAEFATIITRALDIDQSGLMPFSDVSSSAWYRDAVGSAYGASLMFGYPGNIFRPLNPVTREETVVILNRMHKHLTGSLLVGTHRNFTDDSSIASWAAVSVDGMSTYKIVNGFPDGRFGPKENATRAQVVTVLRRLMELIER
ncbi:MAG: S-layer homology domain-containing protein [Bacillota bacterium]|nr:S-layer homology domain-containing protein [Bacillota bacterium]